MATALTAETPVLAQEAQPAIVAECRFGDQTEPLAIQIPITDKVSDAVVNLKSATMEHVNAYLKAQNLDIQEEVDLMEEIIEDDASNTKQEKGKKKRKQSKA